LLVGVEVALALVLLAGAGLMVRSLTRALSVDVGFDPRAFVTMEVFPVESAEAPRALYFAELLRAVRAIPGVAAAGTTSLIPLSGGGSYTTVYAGEQRLFASVKDVTPGYLEAIGLPPREGRLPADTDEGSATAVLSEAAARRLFPDGSAVGREFTTGSKKAAWRVVGTIADVRSRGVLVTDTRPDVYLMRRANETGSMAAFGLMPFLAVRSDGRIADLPEQLRRAAHAIGPPVIVERIRSGSDWFAESVEDTRHYTVLLGLIGVLALSLTLVGIAGVTAYTAGRRTQEIGVRVAFGATPMDIAARLISDSLWPVLAGLVAGIGGAYYATRVIETFLYGTTPRDPATLAAVAAVMTLAALLAAWLPARRAARVDPVVALRAE
jgi:predicted permease